jgi:hypothetical protein
MRRETDRTAFRTGDFISGDAVRGALGRRRHQRPATPTDAVNELATETAADHATRAATPAAPLRRWYVADLIARAVPPPPADPLSH